MLRGLINQRQYATLTPGYRAYLMSGVQGDGQIWLNPIVYSAETLLCEKNLTYFLWCWFKFYEESLNYDAPVWTDVQKYIINALCLEVSNSPIYNKLILLASCDSLLAYDDFLLTYKTKNKIRDTIHFVKYKNGLYTYALIKNSRGEYVFQAKEFDDLVCTGLLVHANVIEQKKLLNIFKHIMFFSNKIYKYFIKRRIIICLDKI